MLTPVMIWSKVGSLIKKYVPVPTSLLYHYDTITQPQRLGLNYYQILLHETSKTFHSHVDELY